MDAPRIVVVGGGISGLTIAYELMELARAEGRALDVRLYDENAWAGGKIRSDHRDGFTVEWGPNGFLDSKPATLDLVRRLGLDERLLPSDDASRKRFIFSRGELRELPNSPPAFFKSRILSWPAKFRLCCEPFIRRRKDDVDETVAEFARRRLGKQALARFLDPMISGVFAGDPATLSIEAAFPRIHQLETEHGSLMRAMRRIGKERRAARKRGESAEKVGPAPGGRLTSFVGGLEELPRGLAEALGDRIALGRKVSAIAPLASASGGAPEEPHVEDGARFRVCLEDGEQVRARTVILATPAHASAAMIQGLAPDAAEELRAIPYARLAVVALGYDAERLAGPLDGFGFLIPGEEQRRLLGALWTSSIFPGHRAPQGKVLVRAMVGGARAGDLVGLDDDTLLGTVREELGQTMGLTAEPDHVFVARHDEAIPNYPPGHLARLARLEDALLPATPGLLLGGNAYRGIGLNDCVANGSRLAAVAYREATGDGDARGFLTFPYSA